MTSVRDDAVRIDYHERPTAGRGSVFRLVWTHRIPAGRTDETLVLPDGAVDVVWMNGELIVAGPDRIAHLEPTVPDAMTAGLRFARGGASAWLGIDMRELVDRRVPLRDIVGRHRAEAMAEPLRSAVDPAQLAAVMERAVGGIADAAGAKFANDVIGAVAGAASEAVVPPALLATGLNERTLRRRCDQVFGYGPRMLSRVLRLQRLIALLKAQPSLQLAAAAVESGYADQPHMTREVRALTALTPIALARRTTKMFDRKAASAGVTRGGL